MLTQIKSTTLISDPVNGTTNPTAIPGAVMEYCILVANAAGAATATGLNLSDPLPATVTYSSAYGAFLNGTVTGATCNTDDTAGGSYHAGTITVPGTLSSLTAGSTETLRSRPRSIQSHRSGGLQGTVTPDFVAANDRSSIAVQGTDTVSPIASATLNVLADPFGLVFDSEDGAPVNGAKVSPVDAVTGAPARTFAPDGVTVRPIRAS